MVKCFENSENCLHSSPKSIKDQEISDKKTNYETVYNFDVQGVLMDVWQCSEFTFQLLQNGYFGFHAPLTYNY
jgi:hypothetical protein